MPVQNLTFNNRYFLFFGNMRNKKKSKHRLGPLQGVVAPKSRLKVLVGDIEEKARFKVEGDLEEVVGGF